MAPLVGFDPLTNIVDASLFNHWYWLIDAHS
jgi:hypothetical protein